MPRPSSPPWTFLPISNPPGSQRLRTTPTAPKAIETIAHFFVINRRYEDGIIYYRKAIDAQPDLWTAHSQLGVNLMRLGRTDEAYKELELAYNNDQPATRRPAIRSGCSTPTRTS